MSNVVVNEVSLRDGLQMHKPFIPTEGKLRLLNALLQAGARSAEVASFVSPKAVPQMADAPEICAALPDRDQVEYSVLIPNLKGLERALDAGCTNVNLVLSATETMNQKNVGMSLQQTREVCAGTVKRANSAGCRADVYIAVAYECPYDGPVQPEQVLRLAAHMLDAGARRIIIADTIGAGDPVRTRALFDALLHRFDPSYFACHFHDTRAMALANVWEAIQAGVRRFDSAVGGLGGCPFSPGASGNLATEDLVLFLHQCGFQSGVDLRGVVDAVACADEITARKLGGKVMPYLRANSEHPVD